MLSKALQYVEGMSVMELLRYLLTGSDYVITGRSALAKVLSQFRGRDRVVLYAIGRQLGYGLGRRLINEGVINPDPSASLKAFLELALRAGHITGYEVVDVDPVRAYAEIKVWGSLETLEPPSRAGGPVCYFLAGEMGGAASAVTGEYVRAREVNCACNGSAYCLFRLSRVSCGSRVLGNEVRLAVLDLLTERSFYLRELSRVLRVGLGTLRWHLTYLERMNLIKSKRVGGKLYYELP